MRLTKEQQGAEDRLKNAIDKLVEAYDGFDQGEIITDIAVVYGTRRFDDDGDTSYASGLHTAQGTPHYAAIGLLRQGATDLEHGVYTGDGDED